MNILVAAFTGLGNAILQTPFLVRLKEAYPNANVFLVGDDKFLALSVIDGLAGVKTQKIKEYHEISELIGKIDLAFLPKFGNVAWLEKGLQKDKIKIVKHYDHYKLNPFHSSFKFLSKFRLILQMFLRSNVLFVPLIPSRHEAELNLDLLRQFSSLPIQSTNLTVGLKPNINDLLKFQLKPFDYVIFQPSVANGNYSSKRWDPANFEKLALKLEKDFNGLKVVLIGDLGDKAALEKYKWGANVIDLLGKTNLNDLVSLLVHSRISIVHDSGAMHLGVALESKILALLGPTDFHRTGPYLDNVDCLYSNGKHLSEMYNFNLTEAESSIKSAKFEAMHDIQLDSAYELLRKYL